MKQSIIEYSSSIAVRESIQPKFARWRIAFGPELDLSAISLAPWALNYHSSALELPRYDILRHDYEKFREFPLSFPHSMACKMFVKSAQTIK